MKTQIHPSSRPQARLRDARSILRHRGGTWPGLLLPACCAVLAGLTWPTRAAVTEAWVQRYSNVVSNAVDEASKVVSDATGDIIVTGYTYDGRTGSDILTIKYSGADGTVIWEKRYNGPASSYDFANAVAVDGSGNVVVTGTSYNATNSDYYTAKYAAADGTLVWEKRGPSGGAQAIALDGSGNVVVTGHSSNGSNHDYYTAKYAAANGALLWEKRYNGPANGEDFVSSLALGPNGMVAITGSSSGDYATVVYRENLPPVSIALVPTGVRLRFVGIPGASYTIQRALAVTGSWTPIDTQTAPASGLLEYTDINPPIRSAFYRTSTL